MRGDMAHEVNITGVGDAQPFFKVDEQELITRAIIFVEKGKQLIIIIKYIIIIYQPYFPLFRVIPCNAIILVGEQANQEGGCK